MQLPEPVTGKIRTLEEISEGASATLIMFLCNHCPFVVHIRRELVRVAHGALDRGLAVFAINSNDADSYPQDGPAAMAQLAGEEGWRFPFLFDQTQDVARAMQARCTPDLFLFDAADKLAYRGQFDDSRPGNGKPVTGRDLQSAIDAVASGQPPAKEQKPSVGCSIKWRAQPPR